MTTITYRDGIMAADSRAFAGHSMPIGAKRKIHRLPDGGMIGVSTNRAGMAEALIAWVRGGADPKDAPQMGEKKFSILWVKSDGGVFYACDEFAFSGPLKGDFWAIGSGDGIALGIMAMGGSAKRAVELVCDRALDPWSARPIATLRLSNSAQIR